MDTLIVRARALCGQRKIVSLLDKPQRYKHDLLILADAHANAGLSDSGIPHTLPQLKVSTHLLGAFSCCSKSASVGTSPCIAVLRGRGPKGDENL